MLSKVKIKQVVIVEGLHDKAVLESVIDATVIYVNGFGIYKDKVKLSLIKKYAERYGAILLTDSDNAGRQIRDYIKQQLNGCEIVHEYVPDMYEVEDTGADILRNILGKYDIGYNNENVGKTAITRERLFDDGLIGGADSSAKRKALLRKLNLPENLSVTALLDVVNRCCVDEYENNV